MFDQYLRLTEGQTAVEASVSLGVDDTYISKLRTGWRPTRVREDLWQRLVAVLASASRGAARVHERGPGYRGESLDYLRGQSDLISELISWALEKRNRVEPALNDAKDDLTRAVADLEAEAEVLDQLPALPARAPKKQKRRA